MNYRTALAEGRVLPEAVIVVEAAVSVLEGLGWRVMRDHASKDGDFAVDIADVGGLTHVAFLFRGIAEEFVSPAAGPAMRVAWPGVERARVATETLTSAGIDAAQRGLHTRVRLPYRGLE